MTAQPIRFAPGETTFGHLKALVRRSALMICNDTGPRHLAIAWNVPVAVVMGPTDPAVTASDYAKTAILREAVPCAPCYRRTCPRGDHVCMTSVTPQSVAAAGEDLLERFGSATPERC
jgi:ADP-heptose:LPS heptosyltransferase